jgi:hypothetical protein
MTDLSNTDGFVTGKVFVDMANNVEAFINKEKRNPKIVYITKESPDSINWDTYKSMFERRLKFQQDTGSWPERIYFLKPTSSKSVFHLMVEDHVGFKYNTFDEFFNGMGSKGYVYYNNDVYPQGQALDRLKANSGLNCADYSQIIYAVGKDLGFEMHYGHLKCIHGGHIVVIKGPIKGGVVYDLAKKASKNSGFTIPGDYWCKDTGHFVSYDDPWLTGGPQGDDGKT